MARTLSADAREKMLRAARSIVMERGIEAFTIDAVAAGSGVAKTTIYRHFASGNELLLAALDRVVDEIPDVDTGVLRADLIGLMRLYVAMASKPRIHQLFTAVLQRAANDEEFARLQSALVAQRKAPVRRALQRGIARGEIDPTVDLEVIALLVHGPIVGRVLHERGGFRTGEIESLVDLVVRAVAPRS